MKAILYVVLLAALVAALPAWLQLSSISSGVYDPVAHDYKTPAEAAAQVVRLKRILMVSGVAGLLASFGLWRLSRPPA